MNLDDFRECSLCVTLCPSRTLHGVAWSAGTDRDSIIDVEKCVACLKCMAGCRFSREYAGRTKS